MRVNLYSINVPLTLILSFRMNPERGEERSLSMDSLPSGLIISLTGLLYIAGFEALFFIRQQGLSAQFAIENLILTAVGAAIAFTAFTIHPALFLAALYLLTMRVRLLIDIGNWFTRRRSYSKAFAVYGFALRLFPDRASRRAVLINRGLAELTMQKSEMAYRTLKEALSGGELRRGALYLAAGYYNLGIACRRTGRDLEAVQCFNEAKSAMPNSIYAYASERALKEDWAGKR